MTDSNPDPCAMCPYRQAAEEHRSTPCQAGLTPKQQQAGCQALNQAIARERRIGRRDFATQCASTLNLNCRLVFDYIGTLMTEHKIGCYQQPLGLAFPKTMLCALDNIPSAEERQQIKQQMRQAYAKNKKATFSALEQAAKAKKKSTKQKTKRDD